MPDAWCYHIAHVMSHRINGTNKPDAWTSVMKNIFVLNKNKIKTGAKKVFGAKRG